MEKTKTMINDLISKYEQLAEESKVNYEVHTERMNKATKEKIAYMESVFAVIEQERMYLCKDIARDLKELESKVND